MLASPPGFEEFVRATSEPAKDLTLLKAAMDFIDFKKFAAPAETYGAEFVEGPEYKLILKFLFRKNVKIENTCFNFSISLSLKKLYRF